MARPKSTEPTKTLTKTIRLTPATAKLIEEQFGSLQTLVNQIGNQNKKFEYGDKEIFLLNTFTWEERIILDTLAVGQMIELPPSLGWVKRIE